MAPLRVGAIGYPLQLVENEVRDDQTSVQESGVDNIGDSAVDDGARIDDHLSLADTGAGLLRIAVAHEARSLSGRHEVFALGHGEAHHSKPQTDRHAERQVASEGVG